MKWISLDKIPEDLSATWANWDNWLPSEEHELLKKKLTFAINAMTGRKYEVWILLLQGKSLKEISIILNMSKGTVQTYYKRGIKEIRRITK